MKSHRDFSQRTHPIRPIGPETHVFFVLYSAWVHLGSFRNCMKLNAKQCELVQLMHNLVPCSHVGIFRNERTQSTPLDPKLMFWSGHSVWVHLGSFRNYMKLDAKHGELVQLMRKFLLRSHIGIFSKRTHRIHSIGP